MHRYDLPTARQLQALGLIAAALRHEGRPPTLRELGRAMGIKSTNAMSQNLQGLERRGLLEQDFATARGLRITDAGRLLLRQREPIVINLGWRCGTCNAHTFDNTKPCVGCTIKAERFTG
jgi:SOS-response transcriptional repressor LexA